MTKAKRFGDIDNHLKLRKEQKLFFFVSEIRAADTPLPIRETTMDSFEVLFYGATTLASKTLCMINFTITTLELDKIKQNETP